jgi:hypothetical protein
VALEEIHLGAAREEKPGSGFDDRHERKIKVMADAAQIPWGEAADFESPGQAAFYLQKFGDLLSLNGVPSEGEGVFAVVNVVEGDNHAVEGKLKLSRLGGHKAGRKNLPVVSLKTIDEKTGGFVHLRSVFLMFDTQEIS